LVSVTVLAMVVAEAELLDEALALWLPVPLVLSVSVDVVDAIGVLVLLPMELIDMSLRSCSRTCFQAPP
jgi:hypothetical protein